MSTILEIEEANNQIKLSIGAGQKNKLALIYIGFFGLFILLSPIIIGFLILDNLSFGFIVSTVMAWLVATYLLKLYLWNKYGKEVFTISKDRLESYNDYKVFTDDKNTRAFKDIRICALIDDSTLENYEVKSLSDTNPQQLVKLAFELADNEFVVSHREISITCFIETQEKLKSFGYR